MNGGDIYTLSRILGHSSVIVTEKEYLDLNTNDLGSDHITHLKNDEFNKYIYLFIASITNRLSGKYNFNGEINDRRILREKIILPIDDNNEPNLDFINKYMRKLEENKKNSYISFATNKLKDLKYVNIQKLEEKEWKEVCINDLFSVKIGKAIDGNKVDRVSGETPYINRKETSNGLDGFIDYDESKLAKDFPVITIGNETAAPFVQSFQFFTGTKVNILTPKTDMSEGVLLFIATCLKQKKSKFNYSFTINSTRLKKQTFLLPVNKNDKPDYEYMGKYVDNIRYVKYTDYILYCSK